MSFNYASFKNGARSSQVVKVFELLKYRLWSDNFYRKNLGFVLRSKQCDKQLNCNLRTNSYQRYLRHTTNFCDEYEKYLVLEYSNHIRWVRMTTKNTPSRKLASIFLKPLNVKREFFFALLRPHQTRPRAKKYYSQIFLKKYTVIYN